MGLFGGNQMPVEGKVSNSFLILLSINWHPEREKGENGLSMDGQWLTI